MKFILYKTICCRSSLVYFSEASFLLKHRSCKTIKPSHTGKKDEMWRMLHTALRMNQERCFWHYDSLQRFSVQQPSPSLLRLGFAYNVQTLYSVKVTWRSSPAQYASQRDEIWNNTCHLRCEYCSWTSKF